MGGGEAKLLSVQEQLQDRNKALELKTAEVSGGGGQAALRTGAAAGQEQGPGAQDCRGEWDGGEAKLLSLQEELQDRNKALELKTAEVSGMGGRASCSLYRSSCRTGTSLWSSRLPR